MLPRLILTAAIERAVNHLLELDADAGLLLKPLAGKVIAIELGLPLPMVLYCCPNEQGIQFIERYLDTPDVTLKGSPAAFAVMGLSDSPTHSLFSGEVEMVGDSSVGKAFQKLFEQLDLDWEERLSHFSGDLVAHKVGNLLRSGDRWGRETLNTFKLNLAEYLQEELRDLPAEAEAEHFFSEVDRLRSDYDRLEARIEQLSHRRKSV